MGLGMLWVLLYHPIFKGFKLTILSKKAFKFENLKNILRIGFPSGMQMVFEAGAFAVSAIMVGWIGYKELAAHQIAIGLASMTYVMAAGIGAASTIRVGNQLGMRDYSMVRFVGKSGIEMAAIFMFFSGLLFIIFNSILPELYVDDNSVIKIASGLIIISAGFQVFDGIQVAAMGALRGLSDVKWPTAIAAISYWCCGLPASYLMAFTLDWGVNGIWLGFIIGLAIASILLTIRFLNYSTQERMSALTTE
jgi:MATE family multidrug resistance protein